MYLKGQVIDDAKFICEVDGKKTFTFSLRTADMESFPIIISERMLNRVEKGKPIRVRGDLQSQVQNDDGKISLCCHLFAFEDLWGDADRLFHTLHGYICKEPIYRKQGDSEKAFFILSVKRDANISDYIPCVAEGEDVELIRKISIGERLVVVGGLKDDRDLKEPIFNVKKIARCGGKYLKETLSWLQSEEKNRQLYDTCLQYDIFQVLCDVNPIIKYNSKKMKIKIFNERAKAIAFGLAEDYEGNDFVQASYLDFVKDVQKQHICVAYQGDVNCMLNTDAIVTLYKI